MTQKRNDLENLFFDDLNKGKDLKYLVFDDLKNKMTFFNDTKTKDIKILFFFYSKTKKTQTENLSLLSSVKK